MTARELIHRIETAILARYDAREAHQIALLVAAHHAGCNNQTAMLVADPDRTIHLTEEQAELIAARLVAGEPMQYLLGETDFYGRIFRVDGRVLIPRPETEELVDWIRRDERQAHTLLDVGTGSGCIAISLALELPAAKVSAIDISTDALTVARLNAERLGAKVDFRQADALGGLEQAFAPEQFDLIVSNPPYIPASDLKTMQTHVTEHEPHLALFVPDEDALCFYRAIARAGQRLLKPNGKLYFEIYHEAAEALCDLLAEEGYTHIVLRRDLCDKPRMLCGQKSV
jgi:release factor glutamine methyltransferase